MKKKGILERLQEGPVLGDGGYLLELEKRGWVRPGPFTPEVAIVYPDALRELHVLHPIDTAGRVDDAGAANEDGTALCVHSRYPPRPMA